MNQKTDAKKDGSANASPTLPWRERMRWRRKHWDWHWQRLTPLFNVGLVRLLVPWFALIPIILTVFENAPDTFLIPTQPELALTLALPFKWWLLWLASCLYSLALAIYVWRCPHFIKKYPNYREYMAYQHSPRWLAHEIKDAYMRTGQCDDLFEKLITKEYAKVVAKTEEPKAFMTEVRKEATVFVFDFNENRYIYTANQNSSRSGVEVVDVADREVFWEILEHYTKDGPCWRTLIWVLLAATLLLFLWAVVQNIYAAVKFL